MLMNDGAEDRKAKRRLRPELSGEFYIATAAARVTSRAEWRPRNWLNIYQGIRRGLFDLAFRDYILERNAAERARAPTPWWRRLWSLHRD